MFGRTNAGGGISPFAFIFATYPAGSVCTCTDGSRTLKLKDTSGYGVFYPPYVGTWIVTATDGTETDSITVEITAEGQNVNVKLNYALWLYRDGNEYADLTGNFIAQALSYTSSTKAGAPEIVRNPDNLTITGPLAHETGGVVRTSNKINFAGYKTLVIDLEVLRSTDNTAYQRLCVWSNMDTIWTNNVVASAHIPKVTGPTTLEIDISSLDDNSEYYVGFATYSTSTTNYVEIELSKMRAIKGAMA